MVTIKRFEEIRAWQQARELSRMVYSLTSHGGISKDYGLRDQLQRAAVSVGSNIAEGFARSGNREFAKFLWIANGSAAEVQSQAYTAMDIGYFSQEQFSQVYDKAETCSILVYRFIKTLGNSSVAGERYKTPKPPKKTNPLNP